MSVGTAEFFDPINMWTRKFPDGFSGSLRTKVPVSKGGSLMLGAQVTNNTSFSSVDLSVGFSGGELDLNLQGEIEVPFQGLILAVQKIPTEPFSRMKAAVDTNGVEIVEIGHVDHLIPLPGGEDETPFGTINHTALFVLGETVLQCFKDQSTS